MKFVNRTYTIKTVLSFLAVALLISITACRDDVELNLSEDSELETPGAVGDYQGFYLLNEGNMGSNKSTLDFFDFETGHYKRNIYAERNPDVPKELGDVGNDIAVYDGKLYAVINTSNKVEVMNAYTTKRIDKIDIPNCRFIAFHEEFAYVTSYAGPVIIDPEYVQLGYVAKINTKSLKVVDSCLVGYQPEELAIVDGKIYVANSGGYRGVGNSEEYERTVSVIDIETFEEERRIDVAYNLERIKADPRGDLWVSSRGDHRDLPPRLFFIDKEKQMVTDTIEIPASNYWLDGDLLYAYGSDEGNYSGQNFSYHIVDTHTRTILQDYIITDGTEDKFEMPYGIMVHPETKDIYFTDAGNYVTTGILYAFDKNGKKKWTVEAGDIPAHFALLPTNK